MNQEGKVISQEREEKYGASFLNRLINEQNVEMEAWICLYTLIKKALRFHFFGNVSCVILFTTSLLNSA